MQADGDLAARKRVFDVCMRTDLFAADWSNCDRVSNYVANLVSQRRPDPLRYANLFSSVLNELLETAFRKHGSVGNIGCSVFRGDGRDSIELSIPCDEATRGFYVAAVSEANRPDVAERFVRALLDDAGFNPQIGLLELAADYQATLNLDTSVAGIAKITVDFVLDERSH